MAHKKFFAGILGALLMSAFLNSHADDRAATAQPETPTLVDPTRPVAFVGPARKEGEAQKKLQLQAIFYGENRREAVINGKTVKVGETVDQVQIVAIGPGGVRYARNGQQGELVLLPKVLQPAQGED